MSATKQPRVLVFDLETSPVTAYVWGLHDQNVSLNQIKSDWHLLSWAAKWLGEPASKVMYMDNSMAKNIQDDKDLVRGLAALLEKADIIITQNGDAFDVKKLNARAIINGLPPIKPCRSIDILKESRKVFKFTSHKLEYMTDKLNTTYKKLKHEDYPGFDLWKAILSGDKKAWLAMEKYNIHDVLSTEEAYLNLQGWIKTQNVSLYSDRIGMKCQCGSTRIVAKGYSYVVAGKYQRYKCLDCGKWLQSPVNLLTKKQRKKILRNGR